MNNLHLFLFSFTISEDSFLPHLSLSLYIYTDCPRSIDPYSNLLCNHKICAYITYNFLFCNSLPFSLFYTYLLYLSYTSSLTFTLLSLFLSHAISVFLFLIRQIKENLMFEVGKELKIIILYVKEVFFISYYYYL